LILDDSVALQRTSARELERTVLFRIARGEYAVGSKLPSCEQLGRTLGVNKNTVSKVYRSLASSGYLTSRPGLGTVVLKRPGDAATEKLSGVLASLTEAIGRASIEGVSRHDLESLAIEAVRRHYDEQQVRVGYVDCSRLDARDLGKQLETALSAPVEPLVVGDIARDAAVVLGRFDLLAVNLAHLRVIERHLRQLGGSSRPAVVPVLSLPDPESLTRIARLQTGTRLLIVSDTEEVLHSLSGLARAFNPTAQVLGLLSRNANLAHAVGEADVIVVTRSARRRVAAISGNCETIDVAFKLDEASVLRLADRLAALSQKVHRGDRSRRTQRPRLDGISVERPKPSSRYG
jgi:GntR family transcriptional regulator